MTAETNPRRAENVRHAIAVMTAWASHDDNADFGIETLVQVTDEDPEGTFAGLQQMAGGLVSLCGHLLVLREKEQGKHPLETLAYLGSRYAGE